MFILNVLKKNACVFYNKYIFTYHTFYSFKSDHPIEIPSTSVSLKNKKKTRAKNKQSESSVRFLPTTRSHASARVQTARDIVMSEVPRGLEVPGILLQHLQQGRGCHEAAIVLFLHH